MRRPDFAISSYGRTVTTGIEVPGTIEYIASEDLNLLDEREIFDPHVEV
jgi:hypothetical protein